MRFRIDVSADGSDIPWAQVHGAARGVVYDLIRGQDAELATRLHDKGWEGTSLRPVGICPPAFSKVTRSGTGYATSERGVIRIGSPEPRIAACLLGGVATQQQVSWGGVSLSVRGVQAEPAPGHGSGEAVFVTSSPVVVKYQDRFLLPHDRNFRERLVHNLRHKADVLGLPNEVEAEVLEAGPQRRFVTGKGFRIGARATVLVSADPSLLDALYDWGIGLATLEGFGWVK